MDNDEIEVRKAESLVHKTRTRKERAQTERAGIPAPKRDESKSQTSRRESAIKNVLKASGEAAVAEGGLLDKKTAGASLEYVPPDRI